MIRNRRLNKGTTALVVRRLLFLVRYWLSRDSLRVLATGRIVRLNLFALLLVRKKQMRRRLNVFIVIIHLSSK
jgi:hypothetical protein